MSSGSSSHLSKSKQDDDPRHTIEHHSSSVSPLRDGAIESPFIPSSTLPYDAEEWKQNFPAYYSGCVVPAVSQNPSLLSQVRFLLAVEAGEAMRLQICCEDADPLSWSLTPQSVKYEPNLAAAGAKFEQALAPPVTKFETTVAPSAEAVVVEEAATAEMDEVDAKKEAEKEKNRARMRRLRAARDPEKIESDREKARERTRRVRASWNEERREKERHRAREYMRRRRAMKAKQSSVGPKRTHSTEAS